MCTFSSQIIISSASEDDEYEPVLKFGYDATAPSQSTAFNKQAKSASSANAKAMSLGWLKKQVEGQYGMGSSPLGMSVDSLCSKLLGDLTSGKSNDELQNQVRWTKFLLKMQGQKKRPGVDFTKN